MDYVIPPEMYFIDPATSPAYMAEAPDSRPDELEAIMELSMDGVSLEEALKKDMRMEALVEEALRVGAQGGLHWRYQQINERVLKPHAKYWDLIINFKPMIYEGRIFAPSVVRSEDVNDYGDEKHVAVNVSYTVEEEAVLISQPPTYRDYLEKFYPKPDLPHKAILPRDKKEAAIWKANVEKGWALGVSQANEIFHDALMELRRDYVGRMTFKDMVALDMMTAPRLEITKNGVTFNGRTMNVGEVIYQINGRPNYTSIEDWRTVWMIKNNAEQ